MVVHCPRLFVGKVVYFRSDVITGFALDLPIERHQLQAFGAIIDCVKHIFQIGRHNDKRLIAEGMRYGAKLSFEKWHAAVLAQQS